MSRLYYVRGSVFKMKIIQERERERERERAKACLFLNGVYIQPENMFFSQFASAGLRGGDCELFKKRFRLDVAKFSFSS